MPPEQQPRQRRKLRWFLVSSVLVLVAVLAAVLTYLQSGSFHAKVKNQIVNELERTTGGRVELGHLSWNLRGLQIDVDDLTIHGLEKPGEVPYAHLTHGHFQLQITSFLRREFVVREADLQHAVVHLIVYPDGSTNQPRPKVSSGQHSGGEQLFALRIGHLRIAQGQLLLNEKQIPLDADAEGVAAAMRFRAAPRPEYQGEVQFGKLQINRLGAQLVSDAATKFTIRENELQITSLKWASGKSQLDLTSTVTNFREPHVEGTYRGNLDLEVIGQMFHAPELRDGIATVNGRFRYLSSADFFSSGRVDLKSGAYFAPDLRLNNVDASADYTVDVDRITLSKLNGTALGGAFNGGASLLHWARLSPKSEIGIGPRKPTTPKPEEGSVQLTVSGIKVSEALRAVLRPKDPLNQLRIASLAEGKVGIRWTQSPRFADVSLDLSAQAPSAPPHSDLPLTGVIQAVYHGRQERIDVAGVNLAGRSTRISAAGAIGTQSQMRVSINSSDLSELEPVMRAYGAGGQPIPAAVQGQASFNGSVTGKLSAPQVTGRLQATNFDTVLPLNLISSTEGAHGTSVVSPSRTMHWDSLDADVNYSPRSISVHNLALRRGKAQLTGSASAVLDDGQFRSDLPIEAKLTLRENDLTTLQSIVGTNLPVTGTANADIALSGTEANPTAKGYIQINGGQIYGEHYHSLSADADFRNSTLNARNVLLQQNGGNVTGIATYHLDTRAMAFSVSGKNFDLSHISRLHSGRLTVGGYAQFSASGSGTVSEPSLNANIFITGLTIGGESAGDFTATAATQGTNLHVEARTNTPSASATLGGDVTLRGDFPAEAHLDLTRLDFDPLLRAYLPGKLTGHSSLSGKFLIRGPLRRPREIVITGVVDQFVTDIQNVKLHNEGPLRFSMGNQVATIEQAHVVGTDTDITASGKVELSGARKLDLHANGHVNLAVLQSFNPSIASSGQMTFAVNATGTIDEPSFNGNVQVANGTVALVDLPNGLSEINGTLSFDRNRLRVQRLTAKSGGGELVLGGYITYANGIFFDLSATGHDIRIRYPEGVSSQATADLRLVGTAQNSVLSGDVTITKFGLTPQFDLAAYVQRAKQTPAPPNPNSLVDNIRLDVHIVSTPELRVETSMARLSGDVDIRLRGTAARPSVIGRVSIAEGDITFNSTTYHLERGDVVFANPVRIEPVVNVEASARVRDYDITLGFHGTPDKLNITYRSEPPLPSEDIIALLAFGRTRQETEIQAEQGSQAATGQTFAQTASSAILGEALNAAVSSRVQKLFGISRIKIDPNLGGTEGNPNARLTVEQQISKDLTVTYLTNLGQYAQEVVQVEYNINRNVSLVAVRDYTGVLAIDLRIRQRKR